MNCTCLHIPTGTCFVFDITQNFEFIKEYGYRSYSKRKEFALELINKWNKQMPGIYLYTLE